MEEKDMKSRLFFSDEEPKRPKHADIWVHVAKRTAYKYDGQIEEPYGWKSMRTDMPSEFEEWMLRPCDPRWRGDPNCEDENCRGHTHYDGHDNLISHCNPKTKKWMTFTPEQDTRWRLERDRKEMEADHRWMMEEYKKRHPDEDAL